MPGLESMIAAIIPLILVLLTGKPYIEFLKQRYMGQSIREDGPQSHQSKAGTPTAGGVLIVGAFLVGLAVMALWKADDVGKMLMLKVAGVTLALALLGFWDDALKVTKKHNKGVTGYTKLLVQVGTGLVLGAGMLQVPGGTQVNIFNWVHFDLGLWYLPFAVLVVTGTSNAVNLTDGLDGLATSNAILTFMTLAMLLGVASPDLALVSHAMMGACVGFLTFNRYPARLFMGDTGSLALGGAMAALAILGKMEFWLILLGAVYVLEALSVILQVISFKTTGKRIFRMSPLHHHFELGGWSEPRVVYTFVTFQLLCCLLGTVLYYNNG